MASLPPLDPVELRVELDRDVSASIERRSPCSYGTTRRRTLADREERVLASVLEARRRRLTSFETPLDRKHRLELERELAGIRAALEPATVREGFEDVRRELGALMRAIFGGSPR